MTESFTAIIEDLGVLQAASILGVGVSHVRVMRSRDSVPPEYWSALVDGAKRLGKNDVTFDRLRAIRRQRFNPQKSSEPRPSL